MHKWHSNVSDLERKEQSSHQTTTTKVEETTFQSEGNYLDSHGTSHRIRLVWLGAPSQLVKVYNPLGLVSPTTLPGKILHREICEANFAWDGEFPEELVKRWKSGTNTFRSDTQYQGHWLPTGNPCYRSGSTLLVMQSGME